jgi:hypothetical protein
MKLDPEERIIAAALDQAALNQANERGAEVPVGMIETSAALGACLLVLIVAVALVRRPYRPGSGTTSRS